MFSFPNPFKAQATGRSLLQILRTWALRDMANQMSYFDKKTFATEDAVREYCHMQHEKNLMPSQTQRIDAHGAPIDQLQLREGAAKLPPTAPLSLTSHCLSQPILPTRVHHAVYIPRKRVH